jgi:nucleotide-binding universal stress UspA family protein
MRLTITANAFADGFWAVLPIRGIFGGHGGADQVKLVGPFRRVLAGFDGSPDGAEAVRGAAAIAARDGGHVVALSVLLRPGAHADGNEEQDGQAKDMSERAEALFAELHRELPSLGSVRMTAHVVYADGRSPGKVVTDYAAEHGFDVLVLGRHGDGRRRKSRLGQVADTAVQACPVPVLLMSAR